VVAKPGIKLLKKKKKKKNCYGRQPTRLPIPGILQARTLEWVADSFSNA